MFALSAQIYASVKRVGDAGVGGRLSMIENAKNRHTRAACFDNHPKSGKNLKKTLAGWNWCNSWLIANASHIAQSCLVGETGYFDILYRIQQQHRERYREYDWRTRF